MTLIMPLLSPYGRGETSPGAPRSQLVSFTAERSGDAVILNWRTISETNNYGFWVVRDLNEVPNSFIPGHGTTLEPQDYTYTDHPSYKAHAYRLKQVDLDGTVTYSEAVLVMANAGNATTQ